MQLIQGQIGLSAGEANVMDYDIVPDPVNQHDKVCLPKKKNQKKKSLSFLSILVPTQNSTI